MAKNCASWILAALTYAAFGVDEAHADGRPSFLPFSNSPSAAESEAPEPAKPPADEPQRVRNNNPRTTSAGFDPEAFERGADALKEEFEFMKKREETKQQELSSKATGFKTIKAQAALFASSKKLTLFIPI
ncbi:hypothetical protein SASPL_107465 [Salvia splendens]|uniref:ATPase family AAA domain-containing protein n=1 Tax=Salvia splendens TaxID=180675 RepID=A0A8X8YDF8_SALSN|nr:hypothetical protein SASPL_107465 [Salvia splendens]